MSLLRRQLPVRSPLTLAAALAPLGRGDARPELLRALSAEYGDRAPFLTASGTQALQFALEIARTLRGDAPIAMPAYGCFDLATAAIGADVRVRLYDVDPRTLQPDLDSLAAAVGDDAAAVVVVHLYGIPVPLQPLRAIAARSGALIIEDAAQAIGARVGERPAGASGDLGVLSFGRGKGVTGGGGGALLVSEPLRAAAESRVARFAAPEGAASIAAAKGLAQWMLARPAIYGIPSRIPALKLGETLYHPPAPLREMSPAVARTLLHTWPLRIAECARRVDHALRLREALMAVAPELAIPLDAGVSASWLRLPLFLPPHVKTQKSAWAAFGIVPAYPIPLDALVPFAGQLLSTKSALSGARSLAQRLWTLPTHGGLTEADLGALAGWMRHSGLSRPAHESPSRTTTH